jgi:hypothetical protein
MILKIFLPKNLAKKLAFLAQTSATFGKKIDHDIVFFSPELAKIAKNCDRNIDPIESIAGPFLLGERVFGQTILVKRFLDKPFSDKRILDNFRTNHFFDK